MDSLHRGRARTRYARETTLLPAVAEAGGMRDMTGVRAPGIGRAVLALLQFPFLYPAVYARVMRALKYGSQHFRYTPH